MDVQIFEDGAVTLADLLDHQVEDWGVAAVGADKAWKLTRGEGVIVAVLDTGLVDHSELPNIDNRVGQKDTHGHGTHVAGIIGAADNGRGVVGVAPGCTLRAYQCLPGDPHYVAQMIEKAWVDGAHIISLSGGTDDDYPPMHDLLVDITSCGCVVLAAAGNDHPDRVSFPAAYPEVIAVSAIGPDGRRAPFAPIVPNHLFCPGMDILSTWLNNGYARLSGTSQATPIAAGLCALLLSYYKPTPDARHETLMRELYRLAGNQCNPDDSLGCLNIEYIPHMDMLDLSVYGGGEHDG